MAGAARQHPGKQRVGEQHRRAQVHVERSVDLLGRVLADRPGARQAGVGHQDVDLSRRGGESRRGVRVGEVGDDQLGGEVVRQRPENVLAAPAQDELRAPGGERAGDRVAQAAGRPGDQHAHASDLHGRELATRGPAAARWCPASA